MLNANFHSLVFIRITISCLQCIGPGCLALTIAVLTTRCFSNIPISTWLGPGLQAYAAAEAAFYLFFLWYRHYLQRDAAHPALHTAEDRKAFFKQVRASINDPERFLSGWFRGASLDDVRRENMREFLDWAFWEGRATADDEEEMEDYLQEVEGLLGRKLKTGKGSAKSLRLTVDPIQMECKSLLWYWVMMIVDVSTAIKMRINGFTQYRTPILSPWVFPPRPTSLLPAQKSPVRSLGYWARPHTSKTRLPVLFIHGIGVGLYTQVDFFHELDQRLNAGPDRPADGEVGILALELLPISARLTQPISRREDFLADITTILRHHRYEDFILASHSYGSVLSTHMLTYPPLASRIRGLQLIDPVTILLHMPDVAYNFTVRKPIMANEWQLWYFASQDPMVAHTLGRHFFWRDNCLWKERLVELMDRGMKCTVSLASDDLIVDTKAVAEYLLKGELPDPVLVGENEHTKMKLKDHESDTVDRLRERPWRGTGLDVLWFDDLDHAQVFDEKRTRAKLVHALVEYSKSASGT